MLMVERRESRLLSLVGIALACAASSGCSHDWDKYAPLSGIGVASSSTTAAAGSGGEASASSAGGAGAQGGSTTATGGGGGGRDQPTCPVQDDFDDGTFGAQWNVVENNQTIVESLALRA